MPYPQFRQHKVITAIGSLLLVLLLTLAGIIAFSEPLARRLVETQVEKRLGRELVIEGLVDIKWHWDHTAVRAEKIRLANPPGYSDPDMVTLESLELTFKPAKLLTGKWEFGDITLDQLIVVLERQSEDDANWDFPALENDDNGAETRHDIPLIDQLRLKDGKISFQDAVRGLSLNLKLDTVVGDGGEEEGGMSSKQGLHITGTGSIQRQDFELEASGASLETLRDSSQAYPLYLKVVMGDTEVSIDGTFEDPIKLTGIDAALKISGSNMADLFYITSIPLPPTTAYTFAGQLRKENDIWSSKDFALTVGESDLSGDLSYDTSSERSFFEANLLSKVLDGRDLGGFIGLDPAAESLTDKERAEQDRDPNAKIIPHVPLALERLRETDLVVTLKADEINTANLPFKGMQAQFDLRDGQLKIDPLTVVLADGTIEGIVKIDAQHDVPPMRIDLSMRNLRLGRFFDDTRFAATTEGAFGGTIELAGTGASLAEVLATSNGSMTLIMSGGSISRLLIETSELDIARMVPLFFGDDKATRIRCGVIDFDVTDGTLTSDTFVFDTQRSTLYGVMNIDMKKELINAVLEAEPKVASPLSAQMPLIVSGTLKNPAVALDAQEGFKRGAAAVALGVLLTPFAAILAFVETGEGEDANCAALINEAKK